MSSSLRDALLQSGVAKPGQGRTPRKSGKARRTQAGAPADGGDMDLARAYALRARDQAREQGEAKRKAQEKKARRKRLERLLDGKALDRDDADHLRHYEFHGKIRRVHVTEAQLAALNAGELAVVQLRGRFVLVAAAVARQAAEIEPGCLALLLEPGRDGAEDDGVPDDLTW